MSEKFVPKIYFERWMQLLKIGSRLHTLYDDLVDLMIREQFIVCCPREMIAYFKQK